MYKVQVCLMLQKLLSLIARVSARVGLEWKERRSSSRHFDNTYRCTVATGPRVDRYTIDALHIACKIAVAGPQLFCTYEVGDMQTRPGSRRNKQNDR